MYFSLDRQRDHSFSFFRYLHVLRLSQVVFGSWKLTSGLLGYQAPNRLSQHCCSPACASVGSQRVGVCPKDVRIPLSLHTKGSCLKLLAGGSPARQ